MTIGEPAQTCDFLSLAVGGDVSKAFQLYGDYVVKGLELSFSSASSFVIVGFLTRILLGRLATWDDRLEKNEPIILNEGYEGA
jgi:hypothetical protein